MKALETEPYTQEEADRAAGMGSFIAPKKFVIKTQPSKEKLNEIYENNKDNIDFKI
jgi:bud site selection protein 20